MPCTTSGSNVYLKKGMSAMVIESFNGMLYVNILENLFVLKEIPIREKHSKVFDDEPEKKPKKVYIPPMSHPWKHASFLAYFATLSISLDTILSTFVNFL